MSDSRFNLGMRPWAFFLESPTSVVLIPDESDLVLLCGLYGDISTGDLLLEELPGLTVAALESTEQAELIDP